MAVVFACTHRGPGAIWDSRYCKVSELKRLLFANNLGGQEDREAQKSLRVMQKTRGPVFLEVRGGPQATVQARFGVCRNKGQRGSGKVIRELPRGSGRGRHLTSGKAGVRAVRVGGSQ